MAERLSDLPPGGMALDVQDHPSTLSDRSSHSTSTPPTVYLDGTNEATPTTQPIEQPSRGHLQQSYDWRTIDPSTLDPTGVLGEELLCFRTKINDLMQSAAGQYVLIVGSDVINLFDDLQTAAEYAVEHFAGRPVLVKKVSFLEPIHTFGGAIDLPVDVIETRLD